MSIVELQFSSTRVNDLLKNALHEQFLQVNPFDAPFDQTYLIHHVDVPDFSFTPSSGSVLATIQPRVHLVPLANVFEQPNQVAPPTNAALISVTLTISDNTSQTSQMLVQCTSVDLGTLSGFMASSHLQTLQQALLSLKATIDLLQFLPLPQLVGLFLFARIAVSADSTHVALRLDTDGSDTTFSAFVAGTFPDRLLGQDWSLFIGEDILTGAVQLIFENALKSISAITLVQGPTCTWSAPPPTVNTFVNAEATVKGVIIGINLNASTIFEMAPYVKKTLTGIVHDLRLDTTFTASAPNVAEAIIFGLLGVNLTQFVGSQLAGHLPAGATIIASNEFAIDFDMPQIAVLEATGTQTLVTGDSSGLQIAGNLKPNPIQDADYAPAVTPFAWEWFDFCSDHSANKGAHLKQVKSHASAILGASNKPLINRPIHIWYLRQYVAFEPPSAVDPAGAFASYLSMPAENTDVTTVDIEIAFTAVDFAAYHNNYWSSPYPCTLLCVTSAGSIYLSLGQVDALEIDPKTGDVMNAITVFVNDCHYVAVDPWFMHFRSYNPAWSIDPYVGERSEQIAGRYPIGQILQVQLSGADAEEAIILESQDMGAQTSTRTVLADHSGRAQFTAYLPASANPAPLQATRARSAGPLRLMSLQRTLLTQAIRMTMPAHIERIAGEVVGGKSLLQVFTVSGTRAFDVSDPGHPQALDSDRQMARRGLFGRSRARAPRAGTALPAGLVQIGAIFAAIDTRQNSIVLFRSQTYREATAAG